MQKTTQLPTIKDLVVQRPWRTIKLGTHHTVDDLRNEIVAGKVKIDGWGDGLLEQVTLAERETTVALYMAQVSQLWRGISPTSHLDTVPWSDMKTRLNEFGFCDCPNEVGPQLRRQLKEQACDKYLRIVMTPMPVTIIQTHLMVFEVNRHLLGEEILSGIQGDPDFGLRNDLVLVFCNRDQLRQVGIDTHPPALL